MMAKYNFLTFLGNSNYVETTYAYPDGSSSCKTRYVQIAILKYILQKYGSRDIKVTVFVTSESRRENWDSSNSLYRELKNLLSETQIQAVDIENPEANNSSAFNWKLFDTIIDQIPENSTVLLDITHAFRSIPIMALTIINYARIVKNANLQAIFYGLYRKDNPESPIVDLTEADLILRWSIAVSNYENFGNASALKLLTKETATRVPEPEIDTNARKLERKLANQLDKIWQLLATCRAHDIIQGSEILEAKTALLQLKRLDSYNIPTLHQLMDKIGKSLDHFKEDKNSNILAAIHLCIKYNLIQQGITLLTEGLITFMLFALSEDLDDRGSREAVSVYFLPEDRRQTGNRESGNETRMRINNKINSHPEIANSIKNKILKPLKKIRNDINHASYVFDPSSDHDFKQKLKEIFQDTLKLIMENTEFFNDQALIEVAEELLKEYPDRSQ